MQASVLPHGVRGMKERAPKRTRGPDALRLVHMRPISGAGHGPRRRAMIRIAPSRGGCRRAFIFRQIWGAGNWVGGPFVACGRGDRVISGSAAICATATPRGASRTAGMDRAALHLAAGDCKALVAGSDRPRRLVAPQGYIATSKTWPAHGRSQSDQERPLSTLEFGAVHSPYDQSR